MKKCHDIHIIILTIVVVVGLAIHSCHFFLYCIKNIKCYSCYIHSNKYNNKNITYLYFYSHCYAPHISSYSKTSDNTLFTIHFKV